MEGPVCSWWTTCNGTYWTQKPRRCAQLQKINLWWTEGGSIKPAQPTTCRTFHSNNTKWTAAISTVLATHTSQLCLFNLPSSIYMYMYLRLLYKNDRDTYGKHIHVHVDIHRHTNITIYLTYTCAHKGTCITCLTITLTLLHWVEEAPFWISNLTTWRLPLYAARCNGESPPCEYTK